MSQAVRRSPPPTPAPRKPPVSLRGLLSMLVSLILLAGLGYVGQSLQRPGSFPIRKVAVEGDFRHLAPAYVETLVAGGLQGGYFQIDVQALRSRLLGEPWIKDAAVERVWPDVLRVAITEQQPVARWGKDALLNTQAEVFKPHPDSFPSGLVHLRGPVGSEEEVLSAYHRIERQMQALELKVARLGLSDRGAWTLGLAGGTRLVLGRERLNERLSRFERAYVAGLRDGWSTVASVDLRYTNGFAVMERKVEKTGEVPVQRGG
jgi:cell division protein FtsQ